MAAVIGIATSYMSSLRDRRPEAAENGILKVTIHKWAELGWHKVRDKANEENDIRAITSLR